MAVRGRERLTLVSEQEYLHTSYRRTAITLTASCWSEIWDSLITKITGMILPALMLHESGWNVIVLPEQRIKVRNRKYRVPDVMVLDADAPRTPVIEHPPLLCIEIVSPDDRMPDLVNRAADYADVGVPLTWILDPASKRSYIYDQDGLRESREAVLHCDRIELSITDLFQRL